jgi:hypothetical protein
MGINKYIRMKKYCTYTQLLEHTKNLGKMQVITFLTRSETNIIVIKIQ